MYNEEQQRSGTQRGGRGRKRERTRGGGHAASYKPRAKRGGGSGTHLCPISGCVAKEPTFQHLQNGSQVRLRQSTSHHSLSSTKSDAGQGMDPQPHARRHPTHQRPHPAHPTRKIRHRLHALHPLRPTRQMERHQRLARPPGRCLGRRRGPPPTGLRNLHHLRIRHGAQGPAGQGGLAEGKATAGVHRRTRRGRGRGLPHGGRQSGAGRGASPQTAPVGGNAGGIRHGGTPAFRIRAAERGIRSLGERRPGYSDAHVAGGGDRTDPGGAVVGTGNGDGTAPGNHGRMPSGRNSVGNGGAREQYCDGYPDALKRKAMQYPIRYFYSYFHMFCTHFITYHLYQYINNKDSFKF
mmetsp:Transcript_4135/g.7982  ORF Transcript_4135/g.7982 Transcript_4135/m.7982 type:complete len:351 (+) Transcript_4135:1795-2847(+)